MKEARSNGEQELFSKVYIDFSNDNTHAMTKYFESFGCYVNWTFGENHDTCGGHIYLDWHLTNLNEYKEFI